MKKMNTANKITIFRIFLSIVLIVLLLFPFYMVNIRFPEVEIGKLPPISIKLFIAAIIFAVASITDFLDGYIARKYDMVTDFGKMVDAIADKALVDSTLIILASSEYNMIPTAIPVIIIFRDIIVDTIKMIAGSKGKVVAAIKTGKVKTAFLMVGIVLTLCYNLPFELFNINIAGFCMVLATIFALISGVEYYVLNRKVIFEEPKKTEESPKK